MENPSKQRKFHQTTLKFILERTYIKYRKFLETLREAAPKEHYGCCVAIGACTTNFYSPSDKERTNFSFSTLFSFGFKGIREEAALKAK